MITRKERGSLRVEKREQKYNEDQEEDEITMITITS
jgi:hypothetical protein